MKPETKTCESCGREFTRKPKWGREAFAARRLCTRMCGSMRGYIDTAYTVTESGCWEWTGPMDSSGYGKGYDPHQPPRKRVDWAHRISYRKANGPIPAGHEIDHTCQNTRCINPTHLDAVSKAEHARRTFERLGHTKFQVAAASMRVQGLTYQEIADAAGLMSASGAQRRVQAAIRKGLVSPDSAPPARRLTEDDRRDIRALHSLGIPQTEIGAWYEIDSSQVSRICAGRTSGHAKNGEAA